MASIFGREYFQKCSPETIMLRNYLESLFENTDFWMLFQTCWIRLSGGRAWKFLFLRTTFKYLWSTGLQEDSRNVTGPVGIYDCCVPNYPQNVQLKTITIYDLAVSVSQESGHNLPGGLWLKVTHRAGLQSHGQALQKEHQLTKALMQMLEDSVPHEP